MRWVPDVYRLRSLPRQNLLRLAVEHWALWKWPRVPKRTGTLQPESGRNKYVYMRVTGYSYLSRRRAKVATWST